MNNFDRGTRFGELFDFLAKRPPLRSVPRDEMLTSIQFNSDYATKSQPVIISNGSKTVDNPIGALKKQFQNTIIKVRHGDYVDPENYAPEKRQLIEMTVAEYLATSEKSEVAGHRNITPPYAGNFTLPLTFLTDLGAGIPSFYPQSLFEPPTVWLGASGCITPLHRDSSDNFAIHLAGTKRWTIFPPHDAPFLYMSSVAASLGGDFATSSVDLRRPDLTLFPLFRQARAITFEVGASETLYLPMGWSHFVENVTPCLMVNHWLSIKPLGIAALATRSP